MAALRHTLLPLLVWVLSQGGIAWAQNDLHIGELSMLDRQYMQQQRELLDQLARSNFGRQFNGNRDNDLELLQRLLDRGLVRPDQTRELQAMGIVMGDLLASELDLHWVIYEDKQGRSRALRYRQSDNYLFPATMIARRREVHNTESVQDIYRRAEQSMRAVIPPLPFQ